MQGHLGWLIDLWLHLLFETELKVKIKMMTSPSSLYFDAVQSSNLHRETWNAEARAAMTSAIPGTDGLRLTIGNELVNQILHLIV